MNTKQVLNDEWMFLKTDITTTFHHLTGKEEWSLVELPHDWLIYNVSNLYETSTGMYKRILKINDLNQLYFLRFEGVYMDCVIYVNENKAFEWKYGYSTFDVDLTPYLMIGDNTIFVEVKYQSPNSRWYTGAGIYRNVWLITTPKVYIPLDGIYLTTKKEEKQWKIEVETEIKDMRETLSTKDVKQIAICHSIFNKAGEFITKSIKQISLTESFQVDHQILTCEDPKLWDMDTPSLYRLQTDFMLDDEVIQIEQTTFGFRTIEFDCEKGFFINEVHVKLQGVCEHHDLGCLGAAMNSYALYHRLLLLKEMGVNAIRTAHNMPAVELMELADELGILIVSESFDMWESKKTTYDYARFFKEWVEKDVSSWIRRDRNHPSLIMWSIGNEIYDTHASEYGEKITRYLKELVLQHDKKQNAKVTIGSNYMPWENAQKCADIVKIAGYNYAEKYYKEHHEKYPDWVIYGSETSSIVQSRGIYHFPLAQSVLADDDEQCSSLGNSSTSWGAKNTESCIIDDRDATFSLGQFIWTGFDYIGEPTPYHTKNSYFGQLDTAMFKKDSYYIYQAEWTDYKKHPMVHIFPYWDFSPNQMIDVRVCSNAPKVELFFQKKHKGVYEELQSMGSFEIDHNHGKKLIGDFQIPYTTGKLVAMAYDEDGTCIAKKCKSSFEDATELVLTPNKETVLSNGRDLIFLEISAIDKEGNAVENANNRVEVFVHGAGRLIGLDNGDSTDYEPYKGTSKRLFSGKLLAVIAPKLEAGTILIEVSSYGFRTKTLSLSAIAYERPKGIMAFTENKKSEPKIEVPIRKIELISELGMVLTKEVPEVYVYAKLYPENCTYSDLTWRVTNDAGIDSNLAKIKVCEHRKNYYQIKLIALGDGLVRVRCSCKNGSDKVKIISQLEFTIIGLGSAYLNAYEFISGGLYTRSNVALTNGNERGVATLRDDISHVIFDKIDFSEYGSDQFTISIFALDSGKFPIEVWEGIPDANQEEGKLLTTLTYQKPSIWNTYQEETYQLPKRIKGIATITFVLKRKVHIKGFYFHKLQKAFEKLYVKENNRIYGDSYQITEESIEQIGNNVTLEFEEMDFAEKGFDKLVICGRSLLEKNTIHVHFYNGEEETKQVIDFMYSNDYVEQEFYLEPVYGCNKVSFLFLPGSCFDFKWFHFKKVY